MTMIRFAAPLCLLLLPATACAESSEERVALPDLAADALAEKAGGRDRVSGLELSGSFRKGGTQALCATTNAYDANGHFIGLTYWQVEFSADGTAVRNLRNVTGLNSDCYSRSYDRYGR
ncbi:hypothetical protein [Sedimentitalea arenosa]|jgi:hypothetical protein|uniref:Lipoprotein n=1 Tax=Sedimentitalea arenosa TaxID=2798803 RepID=A0A8J7J4X7_9RHOB|nr:hypothetical protein [Arenibacterium arenosum]MBJ6369997.1 hypothetical protein [Arenibacterium arenosum]